ncbi:MAG: aconitase/3-isopropylmalate dehydratase large subunit family protein [Candidatus Thermoplasmatota archaeon]|nr:aconitase/3-isopropylmalate dehydratase large subunit family protein [Candidatus Thermoplasmatota archaeon]
MIHNRRTSAEKIFSRVIGKNVKAGEFVWTKPDLIYLHDVLGPMTIESMKRIDNGNVRFTGQIVVVNDHIFPPKDVASSNNEKNLVEFAKNRGWMVIPWGEGIEHTLLIEKGIILPGMLVAGTDSHTVTAGAVGAMGVGLGSTDMAALISIGKLWFKVPETILVKVHGKKGKFVTGKDVVLKILSILGTNGANYKSIEVRLDKECGLSQDDNLAIANMTVEAGAKTSIIMNEAVNKVRTDIISDYRSDYEELDLGMEGMVPLIAAPYLPSNVKPVSDYEGIDVDQVYIGNCSNGTLSDMRETAKILKGKHVKSGVKLIIVPATRNIYKQALEEGLIRIFVEAGATVAPSTCGACAGLHMGVLAKDEVCITNINRNFRGRMGDPSSKVYIANSYVAAASAISGKITVPGG